MNNINKETILMKYSNLKRWDNDSNYKSICPICGGLLPMQRDPQTFLLLNKDRCIMCGQSFIYSDIPNGKLSFLSDEILANYWREVRIKKLNKILI